MTHGSARKINFPTFTTPLIGRDVDVATIVRRLRTSTQRFATLVGTSGTGKTRLSMQIAAAMEADFSDGMAFVPLASITDPTLVIPTIARTLGLGESKSTSFLETLAQHIGEQMILLVLDNFEQVVAAAPIVAELLEQTPNTHVLCTSQVPTKLAIEEVIPIPPLAIPRSDDPLQVLMSSPAVTLFVERIRHVQPYFKLTERNASAVSALCQRLRGLPLAIELVATHSERLQPDDLLLLLRAYLPQERHRRDVLTSEEVIFPVLSWCVSYGPPSIRWLLPRLGVLWGEWREEQVRKLLFDAPPSFNLAATLELMVSKGLLLSMEHTDEPSFTMLDVIRQYAAKRLASEQTLSQAIHQRHAEVFADLVTYIDAGFRSGEGMRIGPLFAPAMPNIRAALRWFLEQELYTEATALVSDLAFPAFQQGYVREALDGMTMTAPYVEAIPVVGQVRWYYAKAILSSTITDYPTAIQASDQGINLARELGDVDYLARLLNNKAIMFVNQGLYAEARLIYEEALALREKEQNLWGQAVILNNIGIVAKETGDLVQALSYQERSLAIRTTLNDEIGMATSLHNMADICYVQKRYTEAMDLYRKSLNLIKNLDESTLLAVTLMNLGQVILRHAPTTADPEAQALIRNAISIIAAMDAQRELAFGFEMYALYLTRIHHYAEAAQLLGAAAQSRDTLNLPLTPTEAAEIVELKAIIDTHIGVDARRDAEIVGAHRSPAENIALISSN